MLPEQIGVTLVVADALETLGVSYVIGGSFASAEDTVLAKLEWYRRGDQASDRQWRDAVGVLQMQRERLDHDYLRRMAAGLNVAALLARALDEAA